VRLITLHGAWLLGHVPRLRNIVIRSGSGMDRFLDHLEAHPNYAHIVRAVVAIYTKTDIGWGLLCPEWEYGLMVFVQKESRRVGVGSDIIMKLLPHADGWFKPPLVWTGTESASLFWKNFGDKVRNK
jgi:GNAT superfamily N-acetyltransferase